MGGHQLPPEPAGYSTQIAGNYDSGYHTTGYKQVIINPEQLDTSIQNFKKQLEGQSAHDLRNTLMQAVVDTAAFGNIPNAQHAVEELTNFVNDHANAMDAMGVSLADFIARVQAAAQLGYEADPETKRQAAFAQAHARMME